MFRSLKIVYGDNVDYWYCRRFQYVCNEVKIR